MQKTIRLLAVLLAAQILLAVGMTLSARDLSAKPADKLLADVQADAIDRITLALSDGDTLELKRTADGWQLPQSADFPADKSKVDRLIERLTSLTAGLPVATTASAQKRFKVADDQFERRIALARGDKTLATLYVGNSPTMRQVYARQAGDEAIYTVDFATYDAPVKADDWRDKSLLQFAKDEIEAIRSGDLELRRVAGENDKGGWEWTLSEPLDPVAADKLAAKLAKLRIGSVLGSEEKPAYGLAKPVLTVSVARKGGETIEYRLGKRSEGDGYVLKTSKRPEYFDLPTHSAEELVKAAAKEAMVATAPADESASESDAPATDSDAS